MWGSCSAADLWPLTCFTCHTDSSFPQAAKRVKVTCGVIWVSAGFVFWPFEYCAVKWIFQPWAKSFFSSRQSKRKTHQRLNNETQTERERDLKKTNKKTNDVIFNQQKWITPKLTFNPFMLWNWPSTPPRSGSALLPSGQRSGFRVKWSAKRSVRGWSQTRAPGCQHQTRYFPSASIWCIRRHPPALASPPLS